MKKLIILFCILGLFLIGYNISEESEQIPSHPLFSSDKNYYSLLVVNMERKNKINNVKTVHGRSSLDDTNNSINF
jgi:hypothetical protein